MKLGIFCFKGSGCAFLIYPAQARIFHSDSPCVLLLGFCTSHRGRVRVQSNCNRPGRIARCFFAKTCERPRMRLFASHRYFNQLSKNDSASKELFSLYLTFRVTFSIRNRRQGIFGPLIFRRKRNAETRDRGCVVRGVSGHTTPRVISPRSRISALLVVA